MSDPLAEVRLSRPGPAGEAGPLDARLYDLVEERLRRILRDSPPVATFLGIHELDDRLGDGSRDALLGNAAADRAHLAAVEALDPALLSGDARFERDLEIHNVRRVLFDIETIRTWERRSTAVDGLGDALFLLYARDFAPLDERLASFAGRLEAAPRNLVEHRSRRVGPQVREWQTQEVESASSLPAFIDEVVGVAATASLPPIERRRLERAADAAKAALADHAAWVTDSLEDGTDDWPIGPEAYEELIRLRAFDGLDGDDILAMGEDLLAREKAARVSVAAEIDPNADEAEVVDRVKSDHPATFDGALAAYSDAMHRARAFIIEHGLVSVPDDEHLDVVPTPAYLRNLVPFAAYFDPPKFESGRTGLYIVTPSVNGEERAMREHNYASISNTSIHEAYPGHHLQLHVAGKHPSLTRLQADAPEFTEGWGMYSELLMREQGFDDGPRARLMLHTDAIWRACRIVLDVSMHRGEITIDESIDFLVRNTSFERPNARAEVRRYTFTPTYQLSYLLGRQLILELRADERRRLGDAFELRRFHDALLDAGSIPISFQRRALRGTATRSGAADTAAAAR
ncbi:MAG TPA: DUF885 domain-containing protein [Candidatus Limnocylindrales bacterium]|nr:DUF885 domain-containing protein [Candidatus Limnocylindrales bacterium]